MQLSMVNAMLNVIQYYSIIVDSGMYSLFDDH